MEEKITLGTAWKNMFSGLINPKKYIENGKKSSWAAAHIIVIIVSLVLPLFTFFIPVNKRLGHDTIADKIDEKISDFSITSTGFYCGDKYEWTGDGSYIGINTSKANTSQDEIDELLENGSYRTMIIVNSQEIVMYSDNSTNTFKWDSVYKYLNSIESRDTYDKNLALEILRRYDGPVIASVTIAMAVAMIVGYYICSLLWGILGSVMAGFMKKKLSVSEMMKAAIYMRTPWYVIRKILGTFLVAGLSHLLWTGAYIIIFIYMFIAISKCHEDRPGGRFHDNLNNSLNNNSNIPESADEEYYGD
jgi:hypothetical protein